MIKAHLIRGGGRAGYGLNILVYVVPEATRNGFRDHKFSKFSWGASPYLCSYYYTIQFPVQQILYKNLKITIV